jgi:hypothetical protein
LDELKVVILSGNKYGVLSSNALTTEVRRGFPVGKELIFPIMASVSDILFRRTVGIKYDILLRKKGTLPSDGLAVTAYVQCCRK